jgi:nitroreductase
MDAIEAIKTRRSIRKYLKKSIPDKIVHELLELGMNAPSAGNEKPWHFIIIKNIEILRAIPKFHPHSNMLKEASLGILVCFDINLEKHKDMAIQDCSAATENILIASNAKGLGAVWLGIYPREERINGMKKILNLPENVIPFSLISLGYPGENKENQKRYDPSRIHYDKW